MTMRPGGHSWAVVRGVLGSSGVGTPRSHVSPGAGCGTVSWELVAGFLFFSISQNLAMARKSENNPSGLRGTDLLGSPHLSSPRPQICSLSGQGPPIGACVATAEALGGCPGAHGDCVLHTQCGCPRPSPPWLRAHPECSKCAVWTRDSFPHCFVTRLCHPAAAGADVAGTVPAQQRAPVAVWTAVCGALLEATW